MKNILKETKEAIPDTIEKPIDDGIKSTSKFMDEFRKFALKGNVADLAIGIIIGAAFKDVVDSLVNDIIMPVFGLILGDLDFSNYYLNFSGEEFATLAEAEEAGAAIIKYGSFVNFMITFLIISFSIFLIIRYVNKLVEEEEEKPVEKKPKLKKCPFCMSEIDVNSTKCKFCTSEIPYEKSKADTESKKKSLQ